MLLCASAVILDADQRSRHQSAPAETSAIASPQTPSALAPAPDRFPLTVQKLRFESDLVGEFDPSARITFEIRNEGFVGLDDISLSVSVAQKSPLDELNAPPTVLAGPFTVRVRPTLRPGYSLAYDIRLRNISAECDCFATVDVLSAQAVTLPTTSP
jgi:hypothetical protein